MVLSLGDVFFLELWTLFWSCWNLDNEGIQEDPAGIGREVQNKKVWEDYEKTLKRPADFPHHAAFGNLFQI